MSLTKIICNTLKTGAYYAGILSLIASFANNDAVARQKDVKLKATSETAAVFKDKQTEKYEQIKKSLIENGFEVSGDYFEGSRGIVIYVPDIHMPPYTSDNLNTIQHIAAVIPIDVIGLESFSGELSAREFQEHLDQNYYMVSLAPFFQQGAKKWEIIFNKLPELYHGDDKELKIKKDAWFMGYYLLAARLVEDGNPIETNPYIAHLYCRKKYSVFGVEDPILMPWVGLYVEGLMLQEQLEDVEILIFRYEDNPICTESIDQIRGYIKELEKALQILRKATGIQDFFDDEELYDEVVVTMRSQIAAKNLTERMKKDSVGVLVYGSGHLPSLVAEWQQMPQSYLIIKNSAFQQEVFQSISDNLLFF